MSVDQRPDRVPPTVGRVRRHPIVRLVVALIALALGQLVGYVLSAAVLAVLGSAPKGSPQSPETLVQLFGMTIGGVLAYLALSRFEGRSLPFELAPRRLGGLLGGTILGAAVMLVALGVVWALGAYEVSGLQTPSHWYFWWWQVLRVGLVAGVVEEIMFRGVLFRTVEDLVGTWGAVAVSALVFGAAHLGNVGATAWGAVAIALEAGVSFALLYAWTRSLWFVIGLHAAWNVVQGPLLGIVVSGAGGGDNAFVRTEPRSPDLLSGGAFGLEASLVTVLLMVAVSAWVVTRLAGSGHVVGPAWTRRPDPR